MVPAIALLVPSTERKQMNEETHLKKHLCPYCKRWHFGPKEECSDCKERREESIVRDAEEDRLFGTGEE